MAAELVNTATSDKLPEMDWMKNIEICELVANDHRQARDVIKAIKKRLGSKSGNSQLLTVMLLEMLMNNIGEPVHKQVVDTGLLPALVKIVKKKSNLPVREKIFLLLDAAQTSVGGASGRFPQYYSAYYELVSAGVQFSQRPIADQRNQPVSHATTGNPAVVPVTVAPPSEKKSTAKVEPQKIPDSSILQKAGAALEVLREVVDAVDTRHPEGAKDEFTLDLVEQCSFQKQRVMHVAMTSRDDVLVAQAIEMNDQLERLLRRHDALISGRPTSTSNHISLEEPEEEEEEAEQLFRRMRKGKACLQPEDESPQMNGSLGLLGSSGRAGMLHRPLIRPLTIEPKHDSSPPLIRPLTIKPKHDSSPPLIRPLTIEPKHDSSPPLIRPLAIEPKHDSSSLLITVEPKNDSGGDKPAVSIPPPPAKHVEREKFFQDHHGSGLATHVRGLSLHSRNASTSSRSTNLSDDNLH